MRPNGLALQDKKNNSKRLSGETSMKPATYFKNTGVKFLFTDIDDTLTDHGQLGPESYSSLWKLKEKGIHIIPITGRPAGWCEMIARFWPVDGIVGENGGFYFRYHDRKMKREFFFSDDVQRSNREKLNHLSKTILKEVPRAQIASDQFSRLMDLAIDFCEDVNPSLSEEDVATIVKIFERAGAQAKVSSIHVNGWFGDYDKLTMCQRFMLKEFGIDLQKTQDQCAFIGDSPNDEPMFKFFKNSFAVANINKFASTLKHPPQFVATKSGGAGFVEVANLFL